MRAGQVHAAFENAAVKLDFVRDVPVPQFEIVGHDRVLQVDSVGVDVCGRQQLQKQCRPDHAPSGFVALRPKVDRAPLGELLTDPRLPVGPGPGRGVWRVTRCPESGSRAHEDARQGTPRAGARSGWF